MKHINLARIKNSCLTVILIGLMGSSCKKQLDINTSPNTFTDVPIATLLPSAQANLTFQLGGNASRYAGSFIQHYAGHRGQPLTYAQYNFGPADSDNFWSNMYAGVLRDLQTIVDKARVSGDSMYIGASQILMAHTFSVLTDMYGDIPFSETLKGTEVIAPKYDKQENIYPALIQMIEAGVANVKSAKGTKPGSDDLLYGSLATAAWGTAWEKYGNSLKLRLLNHLSKVQPNAAGDFLNTNPALINANSENARVVFGTVANNANPVHSYDVLSGRKDNAVANTILEKMRSLNDGRFTRYFYPIAKGADAGKFAGNVPGGDNDDAGETKYSRPGPAFASINSPVALLTYAEVQFIVAEVRLRQNNTPAATTAYNNAIDADFVYVGSTAADAATYRAQAGVAFDNTLRRIIEQKWIVMFQAPYEAWTDWRRTGFPQLTPALNNLTNNVIPRKLPHPDLEINLNRASLLAGPGLPVPFETLKQRVWWDKP